jgi:hypothetical protein
MGSAGGAGKCHLPIECVPSKSPLGCPGLPDRRAQRGGVPQRQDPRSERNAAPLRTMKRRCDES